jgi:hypothetical protein
VNVISLGSEQGDERSSCVFVRPVDGINEQPLSVQHSVMLRSLFGFPDQTAERKDWIPKAGFETRTFDRYREELAFLGYINKAGKRGAYTITGNGLVAIATELPTSSHVNIPHDVAATPPSPVRGGVATGLSITTEQGTETLDIGGVE